MIFGLIVVGSDPVRLSDIGLPALHSINAADDRILFGGWFRCWLSRRFRILIVSDLTVKRRSGV